MSYLNFLRLLPLAVLLLSGCATVPYPEGKYPDPPAEVFSEENPQIVRGKPNALVDTLGVIFSIPSKILLLNLSVNSHKISPETEEALVEYLACNELHHTKVRLNQYDPGGEWRRLKANKRVGWAWRYTVGVLSWAFYAILPQRIIGGDNYSPWSDTISIYSDHPAILIHEGGHAKDFSERTYPGWYGFAYAIPFVALYHEARASNDAVSYLRKEGDLQKEKDAYKVLYPAYGTYVGGSLGQSVLSTTWIPFAIVGVGHVVGRVVAANTDYPDAAQGDGDQSESSDAGE